mgnify:CR=1 FL=1
MQKLLIIATALATLNLSVFAATPLRRGTTVNIRTSENIELKNGKNATGYVDMDVKNSDGIVVIRRGTPVVLEVKGAKARGCGRVEALCVSTTATDGQMVALTGSTSAEGKNKKGLAIGLGVGLGLFAWPLLSLLAIKGGQGVIEKGTLIQNVMVANDYQIDESAH